MSRPRSFATAAVRAGIDCDSQHGAVTPPLHLSSNFSFDGYGGKRRYDYTRSGNPTRDLLAEALAELEAARVPSSPPVAWRRSPLCWRCWNPTT